jgi:hypothetical protein
MKKAGIAELKNNLSRYLDHVKSGGNHRVNADSCGTFLRIGESRRKMILPAWNL